jgi:hypothetical protein
MTGRRAGAGRVAIAGVAAAIALGAFASAALAFGFSTPSRNIGCQGDASGIRCDVGKRSWSPPPKPPSCHLDWGQGLILGRTGPSRWVCAGDTALGSRNILAYGQTRRYGPFTCASRVAGLRCTNPAGHGFQLSRQRAVRF